MFCVWSSVWQIDRLAIDSIRIYVGRLYKCVYDGSRHSTCIPLHNMTMTQRHPMMFVTWRFCGREEWICVREVFVQKLNSVCRRSHHLHHASCHFVSIIAYVLCCFVSLIRIQYPFIIYALYNILLLPYSIRVRKSLCVYHIYVWVCVCLVEKIVGSIVCEIYVTKNARHANTLASACSIVHMYINVWEFCSGACWCIMLTNLVI